MFNNTVPETYYLLRFHETLHALPEALNGLHEKAERLTPNESHETIFPILRYHLFTVSFFYLVNSINTFRLNRDVNF